MKKIYLLAVAILMMQNLSAQFASQNISLLSNFNDTTVQPEPVYQIRYQACWGWADSLTGKEYGIIGSTTGTYIIEVTDPFNPVQRDYVSTRKTNLIWHEYKTFGNYLYIISDGPSNNQLQICDLSYLPDSVHVVYDSNALFSRAHTIFIDGNKMYLGAVSTPVSSSSMQVYSLNNPVSPVLLRSLNQDYPAIGVVHDMFVSHDTVYASCGSQGLYIYKYDSVANTFSELGSLTTYPEQGYNHSTFLSEDHSTLYMCDETPGMAVKAVDVTTIFTPAADTIFRSHVGATAHNPYVKGNYLYIAYYRDGVYIYDITNPLIPVNTGYFDSHPQNGAAYPGNHYQGCWGVYTDLPSGVLLASDMQYGLFCLDVSLATAIHETKIDNGNGIIVYPVPARDMMKIRLDVKDGTHIRVEMYDALGKKVKALDEAMVAGKEVMVPVHDIPAGLYYMKVTTADKTFVKKVNVVR